MGKFIQRLKKLRLRWKLIPIILVVVFGIFCYLAKRPHVEIKLIRVVEEGDWLRIESSVTNLTKYELHVLHFKDLEETVAVQLQHDELLPNWNYNIKFYGFPQIKDRLDKSSPPEVIENIAPFETRIGHTYIHRSWGSSPFKLFPDYVLGENSPHDVIREQLKNLEHKSGNHGAVEAISDFIHRAFFPKEILSEKFVPLTEVSHRETPSLHDQVQEFLSHKLNERTRFVESLDCYQNLQWFAEAPESEIDWASPPFSLDWQHKDWDKKIDWRLSLSTKPEIQKISFEFWNTITQDSSEPEKERFRLDIEFLENLKFFTKSLIRKHEETAASKARFEALEAMEKGESGNDPRLFPSGLTIP